MGIGVGGSKRMVRIREEDGGRLGKEHAVKEEIRWFVWNPLH
jgi:hypothetical protein